ncbi:MAG: Ig domain-containing protein [Muribaculaceae bacterium]|nr:Ig domain-containing protein [Muribaculaceae bacterium]
MKLFSYKTALRLSMLAVASFMMVTCGDDEPKPGPDVVHVTGLGISPIELNMVVGETSQLEIVVLPDNATNKSYTISSSQPAVAKVSATGLVTAVGEGTSTITVKTDDGGYTETCNVTVSNKTVSVTGVSISCPTSEIHVYEEVEVTAVVKPENATNKEVEWQYDHSYLSVTPTSDPLKIKVKALRSGAATVRVVTKDGGYAATKSFMLTTVPVTGIDIDPKEMTLVIGGTGTITVTVKPANATNPTINWSTQNASIATVNSSGVVTAKSSGSTYIEAKSADGGYLKQCKVTVYPKATSATLSGPATISRTSYNNGTKYYAKWTISPSAAANNPFHFEFEGSHSFGIDKTTGQIFVSYMGEHKYRLVMDDGSGVKSNWVTTNVVN